MRVERTVAGLTWRLLMARKRWIVPLVTNGLPVLLAWIIVTDAGDLDARQTVEATGLVMATVVMTALLPLAGLIHGTAAFGQEIEDGTLRYVLAKPVARWRIVATKLATAAFATLISILPGVVVTCWILLGRLDHALVSGYSAGVVLASVLYAALFLALSLVTRRALIVGLLYVIAWEGGLSRTFTGMKTLSVREYAMAVAEAVAGMPVRGPIGIAPLETTTVVWLAMGMLAAAGALAISRLRGIEIVEEV